MRAGVEDVVFCYLRFPSGLAAHMHLSWLDPHKERRLTVVGSQRMATFDDMALERKVTVYDKGFDENSAPTASTSPARATSWSPRIVNEEPLRIECEHFVECMRDGAAPRSDGSQRAARGARARGAPEVARERPRRPGRASRVPERG